MQPWVTLAAATAPHGGTLRLLRRGDEFSIRLQVGVELMNSRLSGSEEALATLVLDRLAGRTAPRLLIGGLGMGFTLRAALSEAGADATMVVAEIVPELVDWARGPMAPIFGDCLDDPRVEIAIGDVAALIRTATTPYDAILLDVDNGPEALTRPENDGLYDVPGLHAAGRALAPGGVLGIWSATGDRAFTERLRQSGFSPEVVQVRARKGGRGARHTIWLAVRSAESRSRSR